ncbi:type II CAAX endopeptidase family protein [Actinomadura sp. B10D3]|uniref:CPBP family intramembrane glutamic endopeptidase n=1 Tax=Actinomadura sp. B10D3 TaxID=3153557 RepID=UPI00325E30C8
MRFLKQLLAVGVVSLVGGRLMLAADWNAPLSLGIGAVTILLILPVYAWVVRRTEKREPVEVAVQGAPVRLGLGALLGAGLFAAVIVNIAFLGGYEADGFGSAGGTVALLGFMAAAAVTEEVMFRGVLFRIIEERTGTWVALTLSALVFGLAHLFNEHATLWGAIAIAIEAGGMLGAAYVATRNLWVPIGLHFGWNFAAGGVFSTTVSGNNAPEGLLHGVNPDPSLSSLITGGEFGPEASLYTVVFCTIVTVVFLRLARRRGNLVPLRRSARPAATATLAR